MRNERGVTLIALVCTIMVLIILTGVTIKLTLVDNNSVIKEVLNATDTQQYMIDNEKEKTSNVIKNYEEEWGLS